MELGATKSLTFGLNSHGLESKDDNEEAETYRDMLDKEYAKSIATNTSLGIASAIEAKFSHFVSKE